MKNEIKKLEKLRAALKEFRGMIQDELYLADLDQGSSDSIIEAINLVIAGVAKSQQSVEAHLDDIQNEQGQ